MNIRSANKFDIPYFIRLVREIHAKGEIGDFPVELNDDYLNAMFVTAINGGGIALIAESDEQVGMIFGIITPNIWSEKTLVMHQLLLYVDDDYRNTRAGYLLIQGYNEQCSELKENKRIGYYTINTAKSMFDIDFSRFGYEKTAETWISLGD